MEISGATARAGYRHDSLISGRTDALAAGDRVVLGGLGTFKLVDCAEKVGRNPSTGEAVTIPARKKVKFRPSADLAERVASL